MKKTHVVIVGGGFGGVYTARHLEKMFDTEEIDITLINKTNYFLFTPLLHEVATGALTPDSIVEPIREVFRRGPIHFVEDVVTEIDSEKKQVMTATQSFPYDYLVLSMGAETNYFGTPGAQENSFTLKHLGDAITLRNHFVKTFEEAMETKNKDLLSIAIVGAGATGVELAAEAVEYFKDTMCAYYKNSGITHKDVKVTLVTATPDLIPIFPTEMRAIAEKELVRKGVSIMKNAKVVKVDPHMISFDGGATLKAHTIVWVAGVKASTSDIKGTETGIKTTDKRRLEINDFLQSTTRPEIFSLGDVSGTSPMLAQVAVRQGKLVAKNIKALANGKPEELKKWHFDQKILLISLGQWYAAGHFGAITLKGAPMWWLWRTVYLFNFVSWRKKVEIAVEWTINLFYPRDITIIE
ncbi:MAG: NAD(P)/FAD-dependent oxidoreductase [Patescibacteria group bacterium]